MNHRIARAPTKIWRNARIARCRHIGDTPINRGLIAACDGILSWVGAEADAPAFDLDDGAVVDCGGRLVTPGLIDCHTHLVHAGDRYDEFEARQSGVSYQKIAQQGGGIMSTVRATRSATADSLAESAGKRLDAMIAAGVTTVEIKSGYGLTTSDEVGMLQVTRALAVTRPIHVVTTFLGAHALPPEYVDDAEGYISLICDEMIPAIAAAGLADAVDGFCETVGFTPAQIERVFLAARAHDLPVKVHAEQLSNQGGAALAARYRALSADHLEHLDADGIAAMAEAGTVATLLPGAFYVMRETHKPPVAALRAAGVAMAVATDCNPGTAPMTSLLLAMNMAATLFGLTVDECLGGVTREAASALGLAERTGTLDPGKACDLAIWDVERPAQLVYGLGPNPLHARVFSRA